MSPTTSGMTLAALFSTRVTVATETSAAERGRGSPPCRRSAWRPSIPFTQARPYVEILQGERRDTAGLHAILSLHRAQLVSHRGFKM
jgi:hypothetical protein